MKTLLGSNSRKIVHPQERGIAVLTVDPPTHDQIARLAYQLYEDCGYPDGRDVEFWLEAERQLTHI